MRSLLPLACAALICSPVASAAETPASATIKSTINAPAKVVYEAIRALRKIDPSGTRELSSTPDSTVIEEEFDGLPVINKAICVYEEHYTPGKRLEYHMVRSDKFKVFQGEWNVYPQGETSLVELSMQLDTGLRLPFAKQLTAAQLRKDVQHQVDIVKHLAETRQSAAAKSTSWPL